MSAVGRRFDFAAYLRHHLAHFEAGRLDKLKQRTSERAVRAGAVRRHRSGGGGKSHIGAAAGRTGGRKPGAGHLARHAEPLLERILAACVEEDQRDPRRPFGLLEHCGEVEGLEAKIAVALHVRTDRQQPVDTLRFERVTGKIKEARVRAARFLTETPNRVFKSGAVGIEDKIDFKFKARERRRHATRVLERMRERASVRVIRRANDERASELSAIKTAARPIKTSKRTMTTDIRGMFARRPISCPSGRDRGSATTGAVMPTRNRRRDR
jgi:hypothetical protein